MRLRTWIFVLLLIEFTKAFHYPGQKSALSHVFLAAEPGLNGPQRKQQFRRKPSNRRPKYYWNSIENFERELRELWESHGVHLAKYRPPPIPNETLLMFLSRHDIRAALAAHGGREHLSQRLGGAAIVPGRWAQAIKESKELRELVEKNSSLSFDHPPSTKTKEKRWQHDENRRRKGYWTLQRVITELYVYVDQYRKDHSRPAVWIPRPSELSRNNRTDLKQAIERFGGSSAMARRCGMVAFQEWFYFEGQLELVTLLRAYLDEFHGGDYRVFPCVTQIKQNGYKQLHSLIQYYGGRKFLAARFSMAYCVNGKPSDNFLDMNWGPFDLEFAYRLLTFIREWYLQRDPPLRRPVIAMPSANKLAKSGDEGLWLSNKVVEYGGYENVARRLGLAFFEGSPR